MPLISNFMQNQNNAHKKNKNLKIIINIVYCTQFWFALCAKIVVINYLGEFLAFY